MRKTVVLLLIYLSFYALSALAEEPDWSNYRELLKQMKAGQKNGVTLMLVDYPAIKSNGSLVKVYQNLSTFNLDRLATREEKLAFYSNAYNILAIKMVIDHWPVESIKDAGSLFSPVWDKPIGELGGKKITLGEIEHKILRPMGDPRIHFAIVCASVSCPDLRNEPYTAARINEQLDDQVRRFLDNTGKGLILEKNSLHVSQLFDWFEKDFSNQGGVRAFLNHYKSGLSDLTLKTNIPYDWSVNSSQ
jgi:hypothetical protein